MRVRVRLGAGLSRFADAPLLSLELAEGAQPLQAGDEVALLIPIAGGA
jgi:hypothetical protein